MDKYFPSISIPFRLAKTVIATSREEYLIIQRCLLVPFATNLLKKKKYEQYILMLFNESKTLEILENNL